MTETDAKYHSSGRCPSETGCAQSVRALFLVDDITQDGGVKTRVTEELGCVTNHNDILPVIVSRCNMRRIFATPKLMGLLSADLGVCRVDGFAHPKMPHGGLPALCELSVLLNLTFSVLLLIPYVAMKQITVIYAHNLECGLTGVVLSRVFGVRCIVDLHGLEVDEHFELYSISGESSLRARFWRAIERFVVTRSDTIVCVSSRHKHMLDECRGKSGDVHVVPCFADESVFRFDNAQRIEMRKRLGVSDKEILFVHSGIVSRYDEGPNPVTFFRMLSSLENRRLLVIVLNKAGERRVRELAGTDVEGRLIVVSCPRRDVPKYLSAADVAMLIRKDKAVNKVASPTKFGEYLLCGLPVIISPNVGESSSLIEEHRLGVVLGGDWIHNPEILPKADKITSLLTCETKQSCREVGEARLSRKAWRDFLAELIRRNSS